MTTTFPTDRVADHSILRQLPWAWGGPVAAGLLRSEPDDFVVEEELGFEPSGSGEHVLVQVEKVGANTDWVAGQLAAFAGVRRPAVSYAGRKDRHARTIQWFGVHLPGKGEPDWPALRHPEFRVLQAVRNERKLRRGALAANRFTIRVRGAQIDPAFERRLQDLTRGGVPNYFGEQRFGREGDNVARALDAFAAGRFPRDRERRGLLLSAARSHLYNLVLARRVKEGSWNRALPGDALMRTGSNGFFVAETIDEETAARVARLELHPSGPLWGAQPAPVRAEAAALEREIADTCPALCTGLAAARLETARRPLRLVVSELAAAEDAEGVVLRFSLPAGAYATAVLRELFHYRVAEP